MKKIFIIACSAVAICSAGVAQAHCPEAMNFAAYEDPVFAAKFPDLVAKLRASDENFCAKAAGLRNDLSRDLKCAAGVPKIGMTAREALATWCAPDHVNTTVLPHGSREQWVYPGRGYLYFDNGLVIAIQRNELR